MRIANENLIPSGAQDMSTSFDLAPVYLGHIVNYSIQLVFTGSPVGTLSLQCSNDPGFPTGNSPVVQSSNVTNWTIITGSSQAISAAGNVVWNVENAGYTWVRVDYVATSGAGSLTSARTNVKGV